MLKPYDVESLAAESTPHSSALTSAVTKSPPAAQNQSEEAVRAGHQRADARSDEPVPLRGARPLPADRARSRSSTRNKKGLSDVSRNARQASRFLDEIVRSGRHQERPRRSRPRTGRPPRASLFLQTEAINGNLPVDARLGQDRQPDPLGGAPPAGAGARARGGAGLQRHQHAHQGAGARARRRGLLQRQGARGRRPPLHRRAPLPKDFWNTHGKDMESWQKEGHTYYRVRGPLVPKLQRQRVRLRRERRPAAVRDRQGDRRAASRCSRRCKRLHAHQERRVGHHGAQPRAELRAQPADEPGGRLRHAARPGRHRQDAARARRRA